MKKIKTIGLLFILTFTFNNYVFAQEATKGDKVKEGKQIIAKLKSTGAAIDSFKANFTLEPVEKNKEKEITACEVIYKKPNKFKETSSQQSGILGSNNYVVQQILFSDGENLWFYLPSQQIAIKEKLSLTKLANLAGMIIDPFYEISKNSLVYKGIEEVDGEKLFIFEGRKLKNIPPEESEGSVRIAFDSRNLLYKRIESYLPSGNTVTITCNKIELNVPILNEDLALKIPKEVLVQEVHRKAN